MSVLAGAVRLIVSNQLVTIEIHFRFLRREKYRTSGDHSREGYPGVFGIVETFPFQVVEDFTGENLSIENFLNDKFTLDELLSSSSRLAHGRGNDERYRYLSPRGSSGMSTKNPENLDDH